MNAASALLAAFAQEEPPAPLVRGMIGIGIGCVFTALGAGCVFLVLLGLPGTWLLILMAGGLQLLDGYWRPGGDHTFSWWTLGAAVALALLGELLEFGAGVAGAKRAGASRRGMTGAVIGGIVGAIVGAGFLLGIGAIPGGFLGAAAGAIVGELSHPHMTLETSLRPAGGAAAGRLAGTLLKLALAIVVWIGLSVAAFVP